MSNCDAVLRAIKGRSDDRGFVRTTVAELTLDTALSASTIQRAIRELVERGALQKRSKGGRGGGLLMRLPTRSQPGHQPSHQPGQNDLERDAFTQGPPSPFGALGGPLLATCQPSHPGQRRSNAYRPASQHETPESGAELLFIGDQENGQWKRLNPTLWIAPNGDAVSVRSMSPELRLRLRVEENPDGTPNLEAVKALRTILDR